MSIPEEQATAEQRPTGIGPGERLQAARIQQGLSIDDVANRMHLSSGILEAIEENNFDEITAPIFVKGYLRAYARIVGLDEDDMIQQYAQYYSGEDPPISSTSNMAPELSVADARIKWTTYLVVLVLAALLAAWWWNKEQNQPATISLDSGAGSEVIGTESGSESETGAIGTVSEERIEPLSSPVTDAAPAVAGEQAQAQPEPAGQSPAVVEPNQPLAEDSVADEAPAVVEAEAAAAPVAAESGDAADQTAPVDELPETAAQAQQPSPPENAEAAETQPPTRNQPGLIAPTGSDKLRIVVRADSWADIKDGTNYQMVYDLLRADRSIEMTGQAPFSVFLGNGRGVEIWFNGSEVDFSSRIRNDNTARLEIGG